MLNLSVIRAENLPRRKALNRFYVTVTDGKTTKQTDTVWSSKSVAVWNSILDGL